MKQDKIILGIDPGTNIMGYGAIHLQGKEIKLLGAGIISLQKIKDHPLKMKRIFEGTIELIELHKPDELAIEAPFFGKNVQSMLKLGRAQGVAMAASLYRGVPIFEYAPLRIKQAITGNGSATKEQVAYFLKQMFGLEIMPTELDATDGLAAAVCHYLQLKSPVSDNSFKNWSDFISKNPGRVKT